MPDTISASNVNNNVNELEKFGKFQTFQWILICFPLVTVSMSHVNYIFVAEDINYRCLMPECESDTKTVDTPKWWPEDTDTRCFKPILDMKRYNKANQTCSNTTFVEILEECHEWIYENNNSIVAEFNLGCQSWKSTLVGSVHNAGMIVSMLITGWIADKVGRKPTLIVCSVAGGIGVIKMFLTDYNTYLGVEFLESVLSSGLYTVAVVLLIEVGAESQRVMAGVIFSYAVYLGEILFAILAMTLKYWKYLILAVYTPMFLYIIYGLILCESIRWQMLRGKITDAKHTLNKLIKMNSAKFTQQELNDISDNDLRSKFDVTIQKEEENLKDIVGSKEIMTRLSVTSYCFFASSFIYYGLVVHSVLLPGDKYTNFVLSSITSFPGELVAMYTFNKYGRRISLQAGYISCAVFLLAQAYSPDDLPWLKVTLFLLGKCSVVICFTGIYTYSLELFPTSVRGCLVGCGNTVARLGSMLAPLTPLLTTEMTSLPSILFSSSAVIAALLLTFTPETKNLIMMDTIAQVEAHKTKITTHL